MSAVIEHGAGAAGVAGTMVPGGLAAPEPARGRRRAVAWALVVAIASFTTGLLVSAAQPAPPAGTNQVLWWPVLAGLMWAAEVAVVRVGVGRRLVVVPLVVAPTVIAFFHLTPAEIVLARLVGSALALAMLRHRSPLRSSIVLVGVAVSTSIGALAFGFAAQAAPATIAGLLAMSYVGAAAMVTSGALVDALFSAVTRRGFAVDGVRRSLLVGLATAFASTSFAIVAVVFLDSHPGELWALAAPTVIGLLGYRAYSLQRGREARLTFLYECEKVLQGPELDDATLGDMVERTQRMFRSATVELILADGVRPGTYRRAQVDAGGVVRIDRADDRDARASRDLLGPGGSGRHLGRDQLGSSGAVDGRIGMVVGIRGAAGMIGTLVVADRLDHLEPFEAEDLQVLESLGSRIGLVAENSGLADQLAASAHDVRKLAAIVQSSEDAIAAIDRDGRISAWNRAATRLFGYEADEMIGRVASDVIRDTERARVRETFAAALAGAPVSNVRMEWFRRDGSSVPISITISPIRREDGDVTGVSAIVRDETDRMRAEAAAEVSAQQLRTVIDGSPLGMGTAGPDHRWVQANPALCTLLGLDPDQAIGRPVADMIHPDDRATVGHFEDRLFDGDEAVRSIERRYLSRTGRVVWTQVTARLLRDSSTGRPVALYTIEDITERRDAEERTRYAEERFRRAALSISSVQDPSRVIDALLVSARDTLRAEYAAVVTYSADGSEVLGIESSGDDRGVLESHLANVVTGTDVLALARRLGRPVRRRDLHAGEGARDPAGERCTVRSLLAVPLGGDAPGGATLYLANKVEAEEFSGGDEAIGVALASHALVCLENARVNARARDLVQELDRANGELLQANEAKTRFLAAVAHELRTPLHAIVIAADLVDDPLAGPLTPQQVKGFGRTIQSSGRHMVRLIDDLSDLARIESGRMDIRLARVALEDILADVVSSLARRAHARGVAVELPGRPTREVVADPVRLRQILTNLIENAVKFTDPGGRVWVDVRADRKECRITVHDTGIGIRDEDLERAFLPFQQVSRTSTPGAGLGLAISRSLAELHGGSLVARSTLGSGSAFTLTLPRRPRSTVRAAPLVMERAAAAAADGARRPILVVDDDRQALALATDVLQMVGYEVWAATGLAEARRRLERAVPALILLDLRLGDGSGLDLIRWTRSNPTTAAVPILVVSADTMPDDTRQASEAGCDDILPKPLRPRVLIARIRELTQNAQGTAVDRR